MAFCYLSLGSNLGRRQENIRRAMCKIAALPGVRVVTRSEIIETRPAGCSIGTRNFLNAALKIRMNVPPVKLLTYLQAIESALGRPAHRRKNSPRTIDIDILICDAIRQKAKQLTIPHPRMFERDFMMRPLLEIL